MGEGERHRLKQGRKAVKQAGKFECVSARPHLKREIRPHDNASVVPQQRDSGWNMKVLTHCCVNLDNGLGLQSRSPPHIKV